MKPYATSERQRRGTDETDAEAETKQKQKQSRRQTRRRAEARQRRKPAESRAMNIGIREPELCKPANLVNRYYRLIVNLAINP